MNKVIIVLMGLLLSSGFGCTSESGGAGGQGGGAGGGGEGTGCNPDDYGFAECCSVPDHMPCKGLSLADCQAHAYCEVVNGTLWDDQSATQSYLGCMSLCGIGTPTSTCLYDPADSASCYWDVTGDIPDGWVEIPECEVPQGLCGQ